MALENRAAIRGSDLGSALRLGVKVFLHQVGVKGQRCPDRQSAFTFENGRGTHTVARFLMSIPVQLLASLGAVLKQYQDLVVDVVRAEEATNEPLR